MHTFIGWCAKLYEHNDYNGWEQIVHDTSYGTPSHNDAVTSIRVQQRDTCTFKGYKHIDKGDLLETLTTDVSLLNANDDLSSFSCSCTCKFSKQSKGHLKMASSYFEFFVLTIHFPQGPALRIFILKCNIQSTVSVSNKNKALKSKVLV